MPTGRRDGRLSFGVSPENLTLPVPTDSIPILREKFAAKGLNSHDLITLVGIYFLFLLFIHKKKSLIIRWHICMFGSEYMSVQGHTPLD